MNTPVSFKLAKLLKEKGYDEWTKTWHQRGEGISGCVEGKGDFYNRKGDVYTSAPTIAEVVMWLHEKHDVWIMVTKNHYETLVRWDFYVNNDYFNNKHPNQDLMGYYSPTDAYEAAIEYTINKLI